MTRTGLTVIAQYFRPFEETGIAHHTASLLQEFLRAGVSLRTITIPVTDFRIGPLHMGYYQRLAWNRATVKPRGAVHSMFIPVIPPSTRIVTVWDIAPFRDVDQAPALWRFVFRGIRHDFLERPEVYMANTNAVRDDLHGVLGISMNRIRVAPPGVDTGFFRPDAAPLELPNDSRVPILHVGIGYRRKGIHLLVESLGRLGAHRFRLLRVGPPRDPVYVSGYRARAEQIGLELVEYGHVPEEALPGFYRTARLLVFPSLHEGAGMPPLEAMACGTNAVVSDLPAHRERFGDLAFYAHPDEVHLSAAIETALAHPYSPDTLRRYALRFSWAQSAAPYLQLYREMGMIRPE